jgi:hypothetical protein
VKQDALKLDDYKIEDCLNSILKTKELIKLLSQTKPIDDIINDTIDENENGELLDLNSLNNDSGSYYLFKVLDVGNIHSLTNSSFRARLRADVKIEIVPILADVEYNPATVILAFLSKFLFYFNFMYVDKLFVLKANKKLSINFEEASKKKPLKQTPETLLFLEDGLEIIENFKLPNKFKPNFNFSSSLFENERFDADGEFLSCLRGVLVDKQLKTNRDSSKFQHNDNLIQHFDLILPNKDLKLIVRVNDLSVTVYFDTRTTLYQLSILPGMEINVFNLIKKGDLVYKANTSMSVSFNQRFDFVSYPIQNEIGLETDSLKKYEKKSMLDKLNDIDCIFVNFYLKNHHDESVWGKMEDGDDLKFRLSLLFKGDMLNNEDTVLNDAQNIKVLAQIVRIYEFNLKLFCKYCSNLVSSCKCGDINSKLNQNKREVLDNVSKYRIELSTTFLIDDHSSLLKLNYTDVDYDLKTNQSGLFSSISNYLILILFKYINEINMPVSIPVQLSNDESQNDLSLRVIQAIKSNLRNNEMNYLARNNLMPIKTSNDSTINSSCFFNNESFFDGQAKIDIYKTVYDYLYYSILGRYYLFYIDMNDGKNLKELHSVNKANFKTNKSKSDYNLVKLNELSANNEQYKSILNMKCYKFKPAETVLDEN